MTSNKGIHFLGLILNDCSMRIELITSQRRPLAVSLLSCILTSAISWSAIAGRYSVELAQAATRNWANLSIEET